MQEKLLVELVDVIGTLFTRRNLLELFLAACIMLMHRRVFNHANGPSLGMANQKGKTTARCRRPCGPTSHFSTKI